MNLPCVAKALVVLLGLGAGLSTSARAAEPEREPEPMPAPQTNRTPWQVDPWMDGAITAGLLSLGLGIQLGFVRDDLTEPSCGACIVEDINGLDRPAVDNYSLGARTASDVLLVSVLALAPTVGLIDALTDGRSDGVRGWLTDTLVIGETLAVTLTLTQLLKHGVQRARPFTYNPDARQSDLSHSDSSLSWPSGHASITFAAATVLSQTFAKRHRDSGWRWVVWGTSMAAAATTSYLRIEAGKHFWTDAMSGAALGVGVGLAIPWLHQRADDDESGLRLRPSPFGLAGSF